MILIFVSLSAFVSHPRPLIENVPAHHETWGSLDDPIDVDVEYEDVVWEIENLSDCDITYSMWVTIPGQQSGMPIRVGGMDILSNTSNSYTAVDVKNAFTLTSGIYTITHVSFWLYIKTSSGSIGGIEVYPNQPGVTTLPWNTMSLPEGHPCRCLEIIIDQANRKIKVEPRSGC